MKKTSNSRTQNEFKNALLILGLTGAAALGHQLVWTRRLTDLLGASNESLSRVLGCFFLGLSLGAAVTGVILPKTKRLWRFIGRIEICVVVCCIPILFLPVWTSWIWPWLGPDALVSWQGSAVKFIVSLVLVVPPSFFMGMTVPAAINVVCRSDKEVASRGIWLYSANTAGGVFGIGLVLLYALEYLGTFGTMVFLMSLNALVAYRCFALESIAPSQSYITATENKQKAKRASESCNRWWIPFFLAFFSGACVLAFEVTTAEMLHLSVPLSFYPSSSILMVVILFLAVSAALTPSLLKKGVHWQPGVIAVLIITGIAVVAVPWIFMHLPHEALNTGYGASKTSFFFGIFSAVAMALGPSIFVGGFIFPLALVGVEETVQMKRSMKIGCLFALNGFGGLLGAEAAYRILLPGFGVHVATGLIGIAYTMLALLLLTFIRPLHKGWMVAAFGSLVVCGVWNASINNQLKVFFRDGPDPIKVLSIQHGREGSLAVIESDSMGRGMALSNSYLLGSSGAKADEERQAHIPLLLHSHPEKVAFLGVGTGITAGAALLHPNVQHITTIELSPLVAEAVSDFFGDYNYDVIKSSKVQMVVDDARTYIASAKDQFDVVIGDQLTPWRPGVARLFSEEHFQQVRKSLKQGGMFCQWFPAQQLTPEQFDIIGHTFKSVFPKTHVFRGQLASMSLPVALIGFNGREIDWNEVRSNCDMVRENGFITDPSMRHIEGLAMLYLGEFKLADTRSGSVNTLDNMLIELMSSAHLVTENPSRFFNYATPNWFQLLERQVTGVLNDATPQNNVTLKAEAGFIYSDWVVAESMDGVDTSEIRKIMIDQFPKALLEDPDADWNYWPGNMDPRIGESK